MRLLAITARFPTGAGEAFLLPELLQLQQAGVKVWIVPFRLAGPPLHRGAAGFEAFRRSLLSPVVLASALTEFLRRPGPAAALILRLVHLSGESRWRTLAAVPKMLWLARLVRRMCIDHVHAYWASTVATVAMGAAELAGVPWSFTAHRYDIVEASLLGEKSASADFVRSISQAGIEFARARSQSEFCRKARVLHLGVEMPERVPVRKANSFVVLCPAAFRPVKGHSVLIDGFSRLLRLRPDARLMMVGEGPMRGRIESLVTSTGLQRQVQFMGAVSHEKLLSLYSEGRVSAVTLASTDTGDGLPEGIPVSLMEAMAYGVPVVATDAGGTSELLAGGAGTLVAQNDPEALALALYRLASDEAFALRSGRAARSRVEAEFDARAVSAELLRLLSGER